MREILFRSKTKNEPNEWIESCNINTQYDMYGERHIYIGLHTESKSYPLQKNIAWLEVIPEAVGQFTGLTDKNGKKIFEGDIIDCWSEGKNARGTVRQRKDGLWIIYPSWQKNIMWGLCPDINGGTTVEVIGNIHDNPELLESE